MEKYKINFVSKTLIVSSAFEEAMQNADSDEYRFYVQLQHDIKGLTVSRRTHKSPTRYHTKSGEVFRCNQYKHLTYENMDRFMESLRQRDELFAVYDFLKNHAALPQACRYTVVRRWFIAQFPDFRKNPLAYYNQDVTVITDVEPLIEQAEAEAREKEKRKTAEKKIA